MVRYGAWQMNSGITYCFLSLLALAWPGLGAGFAWHPLTCLAVLIAFCGWGIMIGFLIWLAGCALVFLYSKVQVRSRSAALGMLCFFSILAGISLAVARNRQWDPLLSDLELGLSLRCFCSLCSSFKSARIRRHSRPSLIASRVFLQSLRAALSFLLFFRSWLVPPERWQPTPTHLLAATSVGAASLLLPGLSHSLPRQKQEWHESGLIAS